MGERLPSWSPICNGSVHVQLSGDATTSDAGGLILREALDISGVIDALEDHLMDPRDPLRVRHSLASQLRTVVLQKAMGWDDLSDTDLLCHDPLWQLACSDARSLVPLEEARPSQATLSRLITCLSHPDNLDTVHEGLLRLAIWRLNSLPDVTPYTAKAPITLDIDGLPIEVFGHQGGSAYNGYAGARIYSPLIASIAETGDMVGGLLREGNAGPAENADTWIPHLVQRLMEGTNRDVDQFRVRLDAGFTDGETLRALDSQDIAYLGRLKSNKALLTLAAPYLKNPPGRPPETPREWCHDLAYQAGSWESPRRVVLVVQEKPDDLLPHAFFLVTNLSRYPYSPEKVLALYRKRGKAEAHMGELKSALDLHLSSTDRGRLTVQDVMARNQVNLLLSLYAYQVLHSVRCLMERHTGHGWRLIKLREQVLKVAAVFVIKARQIRVRLGAAANKWWPRLLPGIRRLQPLPD
ncbi:MAG: IS1380 family transposase [Halomonas sp.]|nr:IS1380 family transposase [Halomonas sp.]